MVGTNSESPGDTAPVCPAPNDDFILEKKEQCSSMYRTYANQLYSSGTNEDNVFIV